MHSEKTRKKIIETAIQLFNEYGCKAITMDKLASSLRISKRTLYEIFDNKESLMLECVTEVYRTIRAERLEFLKKTDESFLMALFITRNETTMSARYARILKDSERYYPELTQKLIKNFSEHFKESLLKVFSCAKDKGDLRPDININEIVEAIDMNIRIGSPYFSYENDACAHRIRETCYTFLRGLLSIDAIKRYDLNEGHFFKLTEK